MQRSHVSQLLGARRRFLLEEEDRLVGDGDEIPVCRAGRSQGSVFWRLEFPVWSSGGTKSRIFLLVLTRAHLAVVCTRATSRLAFGISSSDTEPLPPSSSARPVVLLGAFLGGFPGGLLWWVDVPGRLYCLHSYACPMLGSVLAALPFHWREGSVSFPSTSLRRPGSFAEQIQTQSGVADASPLSVGPELAATFSSLMVVAVVCCGGGSPRGGEFLFL